jgi:hypothetical protein
MTSNVGPPAPARINPEVTIYYARGRIPIDQHLRVSRVSPVDHRRQRIARLSWASSDMIRSCGSTWSCRARPRRRRWPRIELPYRPTTAGRIAGGDRRRVNTTDCRAGRVELGEGRPSVKVLPPAERQLSSSASWSRRFAVRRRRGWMCVPSAPRGRARRTVGGATPRTVWFLDTLGRGNGRVRGSQAR